MKFRNKKRAYTLAEIMLVILVLSIIFAAMAPIFTKRKITQYTGKYNVWSYVNKINFDAFYDPGSPKLTGQLFFGVTPSSASAVTSEFMPLSKIVVRAGNVTSDEKLQRHIQFRYGRTVADRDGKFAGSWYVNRKNILLGGSYVDLHANESTGARDNVAVGYDALTKLTTGKSNIAIGHRALASLTGNKNNVAIGDMAGEETTNDNNVFIGFGAGRKNKKGKTVAIGYKAGQGPASGEQNLFVGAYSGGGAYQESAITSSQPGVGNTAVGMGALANITTGERNIAVGFNALGSLTSGNNNVAIGYNACNEITVQSNKTCIGYNSGPKIAKSDLRPKGGYNAELSGSEFLLWSPADGKPIADDVERVYIGGSPRNYGGDAILEIHNPQSTNQDFADKNGTSIASSTTTIINGNLIVKGRPYFTVGNSLYHFHNNVRPKRNTGIVNEADDPSTTLRYYGYNKESDTEFGKFSGDIADYDFYDMTGGKFPSLDTSVASSGSSTGGSSTGGSTTGGSSTGGSYGGGGGGGGGRDCLEFQDELRDTDDPFERDHLQHYMTSIGCSDRRLKNVGEPFTGGLKELKALKVYNFTFKNDEAKKPQVGVMAQELLRVFPNSVFKAEDGHLKIRWDEMFYATVNAIKELDKKIVALVKRTIKVETQISKLEKENVELKAQVDSLRTRVNKLKAQ